MGAKASGSSAASQAVAAATATPDPAVSHSGSAQGSGRWRVRTERRPPSSSPAKAAARPITSTGTAQPAPSAVSSPYAARQMPSSPARVSPAVSTAIRRGTAAVRPKPRVSIAAASATERSNAPSRTGSPTLSTAATPRSLRPRRRRAARSRCTSATRLGAKVIATTTATPAS